MTLVPNAGVHCVLACLESLLTDLGRPMTWIEIRDAFEPHGICDHAGTVWTIDGFRNGCERINLYTKRVPFHFPLSNVYWDGSLFIFLTSGPLHCVRFFDQTDEQNILVMDPDFAQHHGTFRWLTENQLSSARPEYIRLRIFRDTYTPPVDPPAESAGVPTVAESTNQTPTA